MILSTIYARASSWRRARYARHPHLRRHLNRPVVSVGNLAVGGRGKTPLVAAIARWLIQEGERPVILSRGYARRESTDGVLVVSDRARVIEPVERSGDEPQMLARALPGVPVLVSSDRHLAGVLAERVFDATVHILDDGFQHFQLARDVDLLIVAPEDLKDDVLPAGRLREPLSTMSHASAVLLADPAARTLVVREASVPGAPRQFQLVTTPGDARLVHPFGGEVPAAIGRRVVAVAGIARPERFFATAREQGWDVAKEIVFRDHHWFSADDVGRMVAAAREAGTEAILTTEKDAVRLAPIVSSLNDSRPHFNFVFLPITVDVAPHDEFYEWLGAQLKAAAR